MNCPHCTNAIPDGSAFCNQCGKSTQAKATQSRGKYVHFVWVAVAVFGLWFFLRYTAGSNPTNRLVAAVAHTSITLTDETQNLRANSWRAIPVQPPYGGSLDVTLNVIHGNPLDVLLVDSSQMDVLKRTNDWRAVQGNVDFSATKTTTYHRTAQISQGTYFLVMRDTSLGLLSFSSTDVGVKVTLNP